MRSSERFFIFIFGIFETNNGIQVLVYMKAKELHTGRFVEMSRVNKTKEDKFKDSLKSWGDNETRPFIREKEDRDRDAFDYKRKEEWIRAEKEEIAKVTGDKLENIHLWSSRGLGSQSGPIKGWTPIKEEER